MADFKFLENRITGKWIILAPRRSTRPDISKGVSPVCPFCVGREKEEPDVYRVPARNASASEAGWQIRVVANKFPFTAIHEVIIHSPDHHKNFDELPQDQVETIIKTYRQRYNTHKNSGHVYIFHNRGEAGGESLPHPHTQLAVVPNFVKLDIPPLENEDSGKIKTEFFSIFCPKDSQWPDEIWISSNKKGDLFGDISDDEAADLAIVLNKIIRILDLRHGHEFPFNFYIYPGHDWYLRIIPRVKSLGGFELGTGVFINTQDPNDTFLFIKEHFSAKGGPASGWDIDEEKIKREQKAEYAKGV